MFLLPIELMHTTKAQRVTPQRQAQPVLPPGINYAGYQRIRNRDLGRISKKGTFAGEDSELCCRVSVLPELIRGFF